MFSRRVEFLRVIFLHIWHLSFKLEMSYKIDTWGIAEPLGIFSDTSGIFSIFLDIYHDLDFPTNLKRFPRILKDFLVSFCRFLK